MLRIIQNRTYGFLISGTAVAISIAALLWWGLKLGVDFTGGSQMELRFSANRPSVTEVVAAAKTSTGAQDVNAEPLGDQGMMLRLPALDEPKHEALLAALRKDFENDSRKVDETQFVSVGPVIGQELRTKTVYAVIVAILAIVLYITYVFRKVSHPVSSWKYGVCTIVALLHDVAIPVGALSILGHFANLEVGAWVVTALLTVLGFSVHDTIVVFDRIRENLSRYRKDDFETLVNRSINETLARSINTSLTVLLTLLAAYFFGGESTKSFILTLLVGIFAGTYSSIFIASPLLVTWQVHDLDRKKR